GDRVLQTGVRREGGQPVSDARRLHHARRDPDRRFDHHDVRRVSGRRFEIPDLGGFDDGEPPHQLERCRQTLEPGPERRREANPPAGEPVLGRAIRQAPGSLRPHLVRLHAGQDERAGKGGETAGGPRDDGSGGGAGIRERLGFAASETIFLRVVRLHRPLSDGPPPAGDGREVCRGPLRPHVEVADRLSVTLSGGQKQRAMVATVMATEAPLMFLDEPTIGLDPFARRAVWDVLRELTRKGSTVLLTTHYLDEAEALSERLYIVEEGRILFEGTAADAKRQIGGTLRVSIENGGPVRDLFRSF